MKLYTCTDHDYHWPVGVASIVLARNVEEARNLLDEKLIEHGLKPCKEKPYTLVKLPQAKPTAMILNDGNY